jgi:flavin-binding protein dodecin
MSEAKMIEVISESGKSFEDAINMGIALNMGIAESSGTLEAIQGAWVNGMKVIKVIVEDGKVMAYRVDIRIAFTSD